MKTLNPFMNGLPFLVIFLFKFDFPKYLYSSGKNNFIPDYYGPKDNY